MKNVAQPYSKNKRSPVPIQDETHGDKMVPASPDLVTLTHAVSLPVSGALLYLSNLSSGEDRHRVVQVQPTVVSKTAAVVACPMPLLCEKYQKEMEEKHCEMRRGIELGSFDF